MHLMDENGIPNTSKTNNVDTEQTALIRAGAKLQNAYISVSSHRTYTI